MNKHDENEMISILNNFQPKIKESLNQTPFQEREDLEQEIKAKIIDKVEFNRI